MTELNFKGKEFVFNHHLTVPHRPLMPHSDKGVGDVDLSGNLIIQGDNLHALKALLPMYAGKVDCIFIDPPYNTGNEGWCYNDNVNAPMIREWLDSNPIGVDDGLRHDKWCAMMWPRLRLLHELLADTGFIFVCLDDNEIHNLRSIMDEIWGRICFVSSVIKQSKIGGGSDTTHVVKEHEYGVIYAKNISKLEPMFVEFDDAYLKRYREVDQKGRYFWDTFARPGLKNPIKYEITAPDGKKIEGEWIRSEKRFLEDVKNGEVAFKKLSSGKWSIMFKQYLNSLGKKPRSLEIGRGGTIDGKIELTSIFGNRKIFPYPKSYKYISKIIELVSSKNALILDSFAGSGTTAHAVLAANAEDNGNRKFILVEMEDYADEVTAERVRRVIDGYENEGKATTGLGGNFTYCTLGDPIDMDSILTGDDLPAFDALGAILFHMATNKTLDTATIRADEHYLGATETEHVWMIYQPDHRWLKSPDAALTLTRAREIAATDKDKKHLVFAAAPFVSRKILNDENLKVEFAPLPDSLYRVVRS